MRTTTTRSGLRGLGTALTRTTAASRLWSPRTGFLKQTIFVLKTELPQDERIRWFWWGSPSTSPTPSPSPCDRPAPSSPSAIFDPMQLLSQLTDDTKMKQNGRRPASFYTRQTLSIEKTFRPVDLFSSDSFPFCANFKMLKHAFSVWSHGSSSAIHASNGVNFGFTDNICIATCTFEEHFLIIQSRDQRRRVYLEPSFIKTE